MLNCKGLVFISMAGPSGHWALLLSFPLLDNTENLEDCGGGLFGTGGLVLLESTPPPPSLKISTSYGYACLKRADLTVKSVCT